MRGSDNRFFFHSHELLTDLFSTNYLGMQNGRTLLLLLLLLLLFLFSGLFMSMQF